LVLKIKIAIKKQKLALNNKSWYLKIVGTKKKVGTNKKK